MCAVTVADVIVRELREAGVRALFGVPGGGSNLDLIDAAGRAGLPFVLMATETAAAIAAIAQAEITGAPGACLTTVGPGAASVVNGVACAYLDRVPLIVFTDTQSLAQANCEHQRLDHRALFGSVTKYSTTIARDKVTGLVRRAAAIALDGQPGPVHIDCPGDEASAPVPDDAPAGGDAVGKPQARDRSEGREADPDTERLAALLSRARRPVLLVGLGARVREDAEAVRALCDTHGVPAFVTYKAKGVVPDGHPWFAGVFTNAVIERPLLEQADLLIGLGLDPVELLPRPWTLRAPVVYLGPWQVAGGHVPFTISHVIGITAGVAWAGTRLTRSAWQPDDIRTGWRRQQAAIDVPAPGLTSQRAVDVVAAACAGTARVTVDAGAHMLPATMLWPVGSPGDLLISNGLSTMGFALPAAIGAARLARDRPVVALTGDGGLLMCAGELLTAARERLRIVVIVFADASLSLIEIKQSARALPPAGVALGSIDWRAMARSMGVTPYVAATDDDLRRAIDQARRCDGPSLIEARIDRSNYGAMLRAVRG
jgi:acetolactate synthase-1/2/3 large subunit